MTIKINKWGANQEGISIGDNLIIWRYMDFSKFVSMLDTNSLYFSRCDLLGDCFEGSYPKHTLVNRDNIMNDIVEEFNAKGLHVTFPAAEKKFGYLESISYMFEWQRKWTYINCWHISEYESAALWKLYARSNDAIAVQTKVGALKSNVPSTTEIVEVKYIDYSSTVVPGFQYFRPDHYKRISFSHERELRAIIREFPVKENYVDVGKDNDVTGKYIRVRLNDLIGKVYVAPMAPDWFRNLVENVMVKYDLRKELVKSSLDEAPLF